MQSDDEQAIDQVRAGDSSAFGLLVEKYQRRLVGLLQHSCGNREIAEEIAQETFARAYRKLDLFSGQSQFYTWLARIGMNLLASDRRKKRIESQISREGIDVALDSVDRSDSPQQAMELSETQRMVHDALQMLDEDRRAVIVMRDFDGMEYDGIAEALGVPIGTVRSRLHRARLELKSILKSKASEFGFF